MKIINNTDLSYSTIGLIIDNIMDKNKGSTNYYGKVEWCEIEVALGCKRTVFNNTIVFVNVLENVNSMVY